jgi:hypothetical protein
VRLAVPLDEMRFTAELARDRADLDFHLAQVVVTFLANQLRAGHQRHNLFEIGQHIPGLRCGRTDGELVGDFHRQIPFV